MTLDVTWFQGSSQLNGNVVPIARGAPLKSTTSYAAAATIPAVGDSTNRCIILFYANGANHTVTWPNGKVENIPSGFERWRDANESDTFTVG